MTAHRKSNENQTALPFRFGGYELHPVERTLLREGQHVPVAPKAFDALLCLVERAGRLVRRSELLERLWPRTHVGEASLTNVMVSLRKVLGKDAIQTVSRHGYRFTMAVSGEPGIRRETYERFVRARELIHLRTIPALMNGRELLWTCLAEDPGFAPAWAWLGRASWVLGKFKPDSQNDIGLARAAYERAFQIDPDLAIAHQFYTPVEADLGDAQKALARLMDRLRRHPAEPEAHAGLVQVYRFCGLLEESLNAHARATDLDPTIGTGVTHTLFLKGDFAATIQAYPAKGYYLGWTRRPGQRWANASGRWICCTNAYSATRHPH